jgi:hypothetical protein
VFGAVDSALSTVPDGVAKDCGGKLLPFVQHPVPQPRLQFPDIFGTTTKSSYVQQKEHEAQMLQQTLIVLREAREKHALAKGRGKGRPIACSAVSAAASSADSASSVQVGIARKRTGAQQYCMDSDQECDSDESCDKYVAQLRQEEALRVANGGIAAVYTDSEEGSISLGEEQSEDEGLQEKGTLAGEATEREVSSESNVSDFLDADALHEKFCYHPS